MGPCRAPRRTRRSGGRNLCGRAGCLERTWPDSDARSASSSTAGPRFALAPARPAPAAQASRLPGRRPSRRRATCSTPRTRDAAFDEIAVARRAARCASCSTGRRGARRRLARQAEASTRPTRPPTTGARYDAIVDGAQRRGWNGPADGRPARCRAGRRNGAKRQRHAPEPERVPHVHDGRRPGTTATQVDTWASGTSPTSRSSCCRSTTRTPPARCRRGSTATSSSPRVRGLRGRRAQPSRVLIGETSPRGTGKVVAPLTFLRGALCLTPSYHKTQASARSCAATATPTTPTRPARARSSSPPAAQRRDDRRAVAPDRARWTAPARARRDHRRLPVYLTEFGIQSTPDPLRGVSLPAAVGVPLDLRAHRLRQPARAWRSRSTCCATTRRARACPGCCATPASRRACSSPTGKAKPRSTASACRWPAPRRAQGLAVGPRAPGRRGATKATLESSSTARTWRTWPRTHRRARLLHAHGDLRAGRRWRLTWTAPGGTVYHAARATQR